MIGGAAYTQVWTRPMWQDIATRPFELDPESYDALVDWPRRLAIEEPLHRRLFQDAGVRRVLDPACGTGHHAAMFHSWGLQVEAADISPEMIEYCRSTHGESEALRWVVRSFVEPTAAGAFDAVVCVGNSISLVPDVAMVNRAIGAMLNALRRGGVCVIQALNLWQVPEGPTVRQKCRHIRRDDGDRIVIKGLHRAGDRGFVEFAELSLTDGEVSSRFSRATMIGLRDADLCAAIESAGGRDIRIYGTFQNEPYEPEKSPDLIAVCSRA
jgi:SAM-dependent methyltransferase